MIDLLTIEEAEKLPPEILQCKAPKNFDGYIDKENRNCHWWLRSPGLYSRDAAIVGSSGAVYDYSSNVYLDNIAVRPALRSEEPLIKTLQKTEKGCVKYLGTTWIDISDYLGYQCLLKKKCLKKPHRFDAKSNNYDSSEVKKFIEGWYRKKLKKNIGEKRSHDKGGGNKEK